VGQRLDGAAGPLHRPPTNKPWQRVAAISLMAIADSLKPAAHGNNTCSQASATNDFWGQVVVTAVSRSLCGGTLVIVVDRTDELRFGNYVLDV
jgi:hypothetical protein